MSGVCKCVICAECVFHVWFVSYVLCVFHWCASCVFPAAVLRQQEPPRLLVGVFFSDAIMSLFNFGGWISCLQFVCQCAWTSTPLGFNYQVLRCFLTAWVSVALQGSVLALFVFFSCTSNVAFSTTCRRSQMIVGLISDGVDPENWCETLCSVWWRPWSWWFLRVPVSTFTAFCSSFYIVLTHLLFGERDILCGMKTRTSG